MPANDDRSRQAMLAALYPDEADEMADIMRRMFGDEPVPEPVDRRGQERKRAREEWEEKRRQRRA